MARVTHVKRAQQRYAMKPTIDPATGEQKIVPVMRKDGVTPKTTKGGRPVVLRLTERDYDKPLPMPKCGKCSVTIEVGQPYKWIEPHGRGQMVRCATCPTWNVWEYSSSLSARIAQIQGEGEPGDFDSIEDAQAWAQEKAQEIRDLAAEKQEAADNMESGFGHETEQSAELASTAEQLEQWADDLEGVELPEYPEAEEQECDECSGSGEVEDEAPEGEEPEDTTCSACDGTGQRTDDEPTEEQLDTWRDEVRDALQAALDESPV